MSDSENLTSIKELAAKLKVSDALLKKLVKDFEIETQRVDKRVHLDEGSIQTVREIMALRASGKKNKEIKELFEAAKAGMQNDSKKVTTETKSEEQAVKEDKKEANKSKRTPRKKKEDKETKEETKSTKVSKDPKSKKTPRKKKNKADEEAEKSAEQTKSDEDLKTKVKTKEEKNEEGLVDIISYLDEDEESSNEMSELLDLDDDSQAIEEDLDDDEIEEAEEIEEVEKKLSPRKIRRRQFSYRYIQRQITNDSKRVNYIKQKLRKGRISARERMQLEDSLNHRSVLLSGWVQLLRWVKS